MNGAEVIAGRFVIVRPLARGNMGQVCEALDERTGEKVAVKTMLRRRNGELVSLREHGIGMLVFREATRVSCTPRYVCAWAGWPARPW